MKRIGIDVGGTNTDAVLIEGQRVLASVKMPTAADVMSGVVASINYLQRHDPAPERPVGAVMIGTTHFTNAVVERARLERVAALRIALPASAGLPPLVDWPEDLRSAVNPLIEMVHGGHEYDGRSLVPLNLAELREAAMRIRDAGITAIAVTALFSPLIDDAEVEAAAILREFIPTARITLSSTLGRIGLLERENVAVLNAALQGLSQRTVSAFSEALKKARIDAPFYITQNDGTVALARLAADTPVYSFASGPTNSMRGAAFLSGLDDAMVVDVGGTTADIGCVVAGFPRQANNVVRIGGVRTLFRMPDLLPIGLGGGTIVDPHSLQIGPQSVGYRLTEKGLVFGGDTLTLTDVAVAAGLADIGDPGLVQHLDRTLVDTVMARSRAMLEKSVDQMKTSPEPVKLIAAGGGAFLVPDTVKGCREVIRLPHAEVADALGAAMAQVSGEVDQVFSGLERDVARAEAEGIARARAVEAGADAASLRVIEAEDIPIAYLPGKARRVRVRVIGDIDFANHVGASAQMADAK